MLILMEYQFLDLAVKELNYSMVYLGIIVLLGFKLGVAGNKNPFID